jgi:hypothetical protein
MPRGRIEHEMISHYGVIVEMSVGTVTGLLDQGFSLIAFQAVGGRNLEALPLVWSITSNFGTRLPLAWDVTFDAYTSSTAIVPGNVILAGSTSAIRTGQTLDVGLGGIGTVVNHGQAATIGFSNETTTAFTCGICQPINEVMSPVCAWPLNGGNRLFIAPLPVIVLLFTTLPLRIGEAFGPPRHSGIEVESITPGVGEAISSIVAIDMTARAAATIGYDINSGWDIGDATWKRTVPLSQLVATLIQADSPITTSGTRPSALRSR